MPLDHRVAHSIARDSIQSIREKGWINGEEYKSARGKVFQNNPFSLPTTLKGARRKVAEMKNLIAKKAVAVIEGEDRKKGPYLSWIGLEGFRLDEVENAEKYGVRDDHVVVMEYTFHALRESFFLYSGASYAIAVISLHALARFHQRSRKNDGKNMVDAVRQMLPGIMLMHVASKEAGVRQIFCPTDEGMFVGEMLRKNGASTGIPHFRTFLRGDCLAPRWDACREAFMGVFPDTLGDTCQSIGKNILQQAEMDDETTLSVDNFVSTLRQPIFNWLREDYSQRFDPSAEYWEDHREQGEKF